MISHAWPGAKVLPLPRMAAVPQATEIDTPDVLAEYAKSVGAGPGWKFLTGRPRDILLLRQKLGYYDPELDFDDNSQHLGFLLMGNEPYGWWGTVPATAAPRLRSKSSRVFFLNNWWVPMLPTAIG